MGTETHWKQNFDYKYTGAYELSPGETRTLTIKRTCNEDVMSTSGQKQNCFVAYFNEHSKPMVLNKTNCKTISKLHGPFVEKWIGKKITIEARQVKAFGEMVDALRVRNSIPVDTAIDTKAIEFKLDVCSNLDELKEVYMSLSKPEQFAMAAYKDRLKSKLQGGSI